MMFGRDECIIYPVPISNGRFARIELPFTFSKEDAEKVARVVISLANPPHSAIQTERQCTTPDH
jgi:hypothetical protein